MFKEVIIHNNTVENQIICSYLSVVILIL